MTTNVLQFLESFDRLPEPEKREAAAEILRRSLALDAPALDGQALVENAESLSYNWTSKKPAMDQPDRGEVWLVDLGLVAAVESAVKLWPGLD